MSLPELEAKLAAAIAAADAARAACREARAAYSVARAAEDRARGALWVAERKAEDAEKVRAGIVEEIKAAKEGR